MGTIVGKSDDEYSVIGDKGDLGFIDWENDKSVCSYNPEQESELFTLSVPFALVNGKPKWGYVGDVIFDQITVTNLVNEPLEIWSVSIYDSKPENVFTLSIQKPPTSEDDEKYRASFVESPSLEDRILRAGQSLTLWLSCKPKEIGMHTAAVHITVGDETLERLVFILAEDKISQSLVPEKPYLRTRKKKQSIVNVYAGESYVKGTRPSRAANRTFKVYLPEFKIPKEIRTLVESKQIPEVITQGLTEVNYASYFMNLLYMEEIKMEEDMRDYNMENVIMKSKGAYFLTLEVPGLAERRPSLTMGDFVLAKLASEDSSSTKAYQGFVHRVEAEEVHLKFDGELHIRHRENDFYNVQFTYNRVGFKRIYQAIKTAEKLGTELLFPSESSELRTIQPVKLSEPVSATLNNEQRSAIEMILGCKGGSPYVIHGPPGTGKTMTLVQAIIQLLNTRRHVKILVCAPSNSAADHILENLLSKKEINRKKPEVFRLNAISRPYDDVNPELLDYCYFEEFEFKCPPLRDLLGYKVIISTYTSASLLLAEGMRAGHFSHIFLDEAGQASEPETMVPLSHYSPLTVVILAGDPMQLGPVVFSKDAENYGLGKSYLERLFESKLYKEGNDNYITKLLRNYRSHPAILKLPSDLFYNGKLVSCKESDPNEGNNWRDLLVNKEFPVLMIGVQGCDEREGSNPSWFNRTEASKVVEIILNLTENKGVNEKDIGVITPYRQQVMKIRKALNCSEIKVGSVEQFQGQEKKVIIVSTVRSTIKHNEFDKAHYLGFLSNPRRFNVAITRAKSFLIVIGNPHIICKDSYWNKLLWYCHENDSYKGCFLPEKEEVIESQTCDWGQSSSQVVEWGQDPPIVSQSDDWGDGNGNGWDEKQNVQPSSGVDDWAQDTTEWAQDTTEWGAQEKTEWGAQDKTEWGAQDQTEWAQDTTEWGAQDKTELGAQDKTELGAQDTTEWGPDKTEWAQNMPEWGKDTSEWGTQENSEWVAQDTTEWGAENTTEWGAEETTEWAQGYNGDGEWVPEAREEEYLEEANEFLAEQEMERKGKSSTSGGSAANANWGQRAVKKSQWGDDRK